METNVNDFQRLREHAKAVFEEALQISVGKEHMMGDTVKEHLSWHVEENIHDLFTDKKNLYDPNMEPWDCKEFMVDLLTLLAKPGMLDALPQRRGEAADKLQKLYRFFDAMDNEQTAMYIDYLSLVRFPGMMTEEERTDRLNRYDFSKRNTAPNSYFKNRLIKKDVDLDLEKQRLSWYFKK